LLDREKACKVLIDNHADVNAKNNYGKTPLDVASTDEIKQLLLDRGAKYGSELK
jgi:ankyrin repeat protein